MASRKVFAEFVVGPQSRDAWATTELKVSADAWPSARLVIEWWGPRGYIGRLVGFESDAPAKAPIGVEFPHGTGWYSAVVIDSATGETLAEAPLKVSHWS